MPAGDGDGLDDRLADLERELGELDLVETTEVSGPGEVGEDRHDGGLLGAWSERRLAV